MKIFVIASTEYEANMPDLFLMDEGGNYYGVSEHSYPKWHKFPKSIDYWRNAEGSDAGRWFNIDEVELSAELVEEFDKLTKVYEETPPTEMLKRRELWRQRTVLFCTFSKKVTEAISDNDNIKRP